MGSNKINDLLEDLQDTIENSILNKPVSNEIKESKNVSQLVDTLNKTDDFDEVTDTDTELKISKAVPTPSVFDEALRSQNKFKSKSQSGAGSLSDTKEVPVGTKSKPKESSRVNPEKEEKKRQSSIGEIEIETVSDSDLSSDKSIKIGGDYEIKEIENDSSFMDFELLKAIGIGKTEVTEEYIPGEHISKPQNERASYGGKSESQKKTANAFFKVINKEFVNREQVNDIFAAYQKAYMSEFIKLIAGSLFLLILIYMEIAPYLHWKMPSWYNINFYNLPYIWTDLQLLFLVAALNSKSLILGLKSFLSGNINVYSMSVFFLAVGFIQTMLTLLLRYNNSNMVLYNAAAAYCIVLTSVYNMLDMDFEITSLKTVSLKKPKYALSLAGSSSFSNSPKPSTSNSSNFSQPYNSVHLESELFKDILPHETAVGGILKTHFISNFFSRTYKGKNSGGIIKYFIYISLLGALVLFVYLIGFGSERDWYGSLSAVAVLLLGSIPLCSFIIESFPVYRAQKKARLAGSAFIGGKGLDESAETAIISIYDKDIFPSDQIKISGIKVYGNNRIDTVLQNLCIVFEKLNMPPADTFKASTNFDKNFNKNIKFVSIDDYGICYISNREKLFLGNSEYISNIGLVPSYDHNFDEPFAKSAGSIMFLASENEIMAKVYLKYELTADFHEIIKNIKKINACLCIRTFDPSIDDALIESLGNLKKYPVRVLKLKDLANIHAEPEQMDSPVVSKDSVKSLINAILIAGKTKTVIKSNVLIQTVVFALSMALALILGFTGHLGIINSGLLILLQTVWMLPVIILSGLNN